MQDLPSSSREATERAETVGGGEPQSNAEGEAATATESNQRNGGDVSSEEDKEKRLSQTEGDSSSNAPSAGELEFFFIIH